MNNIHFVMNSKGGIGKTWVATLLAQYLKKDGKLVACADTDPLTKTFFKFKSLDVAAIEIYENGKINQSKFDPIIENILSTDCDYVIDTGGSTFIDLTKYIEDNNVFGTLHDAGKKVFIHTPIVGGNSAIDSVTGFDNILKIKSSQFKIVVWENEFNELVKTDGNFTLDAILFKSAIKSGKVSGCVKIKYRKDSDTFSADISKMTANFMTFDDVSKSDDFGYMAKNRIKTVMTDLYTELDKLSQIC